MLMTDGVIYWMPDSGSSFEAGDGDCNDWNSRAVAVISSANQVKAFSSGDLPRPIRGQESAVAVMAMFEINGWLSEGIVLDISIIAILWQTIQRSWLSEQQLLKVTSRKLKEKYRRKVLRKKRILFKNAFLAYIGHILHCYI